MKRRNFFGSLAALFTTFLVNKTDGMNKPPADETRTVNGGIRWDKIEVPEANSWRSVLRNGSDVCVAVESGGVRRIMRSIDGGNTWSFAEAPEASSWMGLNESRPDEPKGEGETEG